jgi:hypothetical protein
MPRPQFSLRSLLVAMLVVVAFFGGMALQGALDKPMHWIDDLEREGITLRNGTSWLRPADR